MAKTFAFECGECCNGVLMIDGYRETVFDEDDWDSFLSAAAGFGISEKAVSVNMCSDCDLHYN